MTRSTLSALGCLLCLLCAGCGSDERPAEPVSEVPPRPAAALLWVRAAQELDTPAELDRRLAAFPLDRAGFRKSTEAQIVLTWRLQRALGEGRIEQAATVRERIERDFDGSGRTPRGHAIRAPLLRAGFVSAAVEAAQRRIEGDAPDLEGTRRAMALARAAADDASKQEIDARARWIESERLEALGLELTPHKGARVVVLADDFALGEAILPSVLGRWQRELGPMGLRVSVVPILTGQVRAGMRRLPARDAQAEVDSIQNRLIARRVRVERSAPSDVRAGLGLAPNACALLVSDRRGMIVARLSGPTLDPRRLETLVQRAASR